MVEVTFRRKVSKVGQASLFVNILIEILEFFDVKQGDSCWVKISEDGMTVAFANPEGTDGFKE